MSAGSIIQVARRLYKWLWVVWILVLVVAVTTVVFRKYFFQEREIKACINKEHLLVQERLVYADSTLSANSWKWEFGDGDSSSFRTGYHKYPFPGKFLIKLTVNNRRTQWFLVQVHKERVMTMEDSVVRIIGPSYGVQGEYLYFKATGNATKWRWSMGERAGMVSSEPSLTYQYRVPGTYTISLETDRTQYPVRFQVKVLPAYRRSAAARTDEASEDIRGHLQQIANGADFNTHYYYLVNKYLCQHERIAVRVRQNEVSEFYADFYSYCMGLRLDKRVLVASLTTVGKQGLDNKQCITQISIVQRRK